MTASGILIVEDERIVAKDIENSLKKMGHTVCGIVSTGAEAIDKTREMRPDLVLMDVRLKGQMDGIEAAERVRTEFHVPVVYLTAHADENTLNRAKVTGPFGYILKPFNDKDLHIAIDMALYKHAMDSKLAESEERYRLIFETSRDAIFVINPHGEIEDCNESLTELLLASRGELIGMRFGDLFVDPQDLAHIVEELERKRFVRDYEVKLYNKEKKTMECRITSSVMVGRDGATVAYQGSIRDIRQQKRLEEQLLHAQKLEAIGTLASGVAHDFNNILTSIMGYGTMLQTRMDPDDPLQKHAESIVLSCEKAADLTRSLLTFSRKQPTEMKPVYINPVIEGIKKLLVRLVTEGVALDTALSDDPLKIMADTGQIEQILMNFVSNANDAMPDGGTITIGTAQSSIDSVFIETHGYGAVGDYALLTVSDTGSGMDLATRERIFEPFFTTKEADKGTGLGLALVYGIVKQHKGWINVYSEPGAGTVFKVYLPLIDLVVARQEKTATAQSPGGKETILIAEDNSQVRTFMKLVLSDYGYRILEAGDGEEALKMFEQYNQEGIDLIILDAIMPRKDGWWVYDSVRRIKPEIKAIFMSGHTWDTVRERHIMEMDLPFIQKPLKLNELLQKVRETLDATQDR